MSAMRVLMMLMILGPVASLAQEEESTDQDEVAAQPEADAETEESGVKTMLGMSILGNEEAPKSLVIVPWKSSQIGDGLGVSNALDDRPGPVDRDVFLREVRYYELRAGSAE